MLRSTNTVAEAVQVVAREHRFHPVLDYLVALEWDKVPRLDSWLTTYLGVAESEFTRACGSRWVISAVARIFRPGCQADYTLLLEGLTGIQKSSALRALVGDEWFADHLGDLGSKDSRLDLHGKWVIELSELVSMRKAEIEKVKAFLTTRVDHFRPPYARRSEDVPRSNVFAASTNERQPFVDATGNRRFWPVRCTIIDVQAIRRDRNQLWAEAAARYRAGEVWWLDTDELNQLAEIEQRARYQPGPWDTAILAWVDAPFQRNEYDPVARQTLPVSPWDNSEPGKVTITDVLVHAVGKKLEHCTPSDYHQVARCLTHEGWEPSRNWKRGADRGARFYVKEAESW